MKQKFERQDTHPSHSGLAESSVGGEGPAPRIQLYSSEGCGQSRGRCLWHPQI